MSEYGDKEYYIDSDGGMHEIFRTDAEGYRTEPYYRAGEYDKSVSEGEISTFNWSDAG